MMMAKLILTMNLLLMDNKAPDLIVAMILSLTLTILMNLIMSMNMRYEDEEEELPKTIGTQHCDSRENNTKDLYHYLLKSSDPLLNNS